MANIRSMISHANCLTFVFFVVVTKGTIVASEGGAFVSYAIASSNGNSNIQSSSSIAGSDSRGLGSASFVSGQNDESRGSAFSAAYVGGKNEGDGSRSAGSAAGSSSAAGFNPASMLNTFSSVVPGFAESAASDASYPSERKGSGTAGRKGSASAVAEGASVASGTSYISSDSSGSSSSSVRRSSKSGSSSGSQSRRGESSAKYDSNEDFDEVYGGPIEVLVIKRYRGKGKGSRKGSGSSKKDWSSIKTGSEWSSEFEEDSVTEIKKRRKGNSGSQNGGKNSERYRDKEGGEGSGFNDSEELEGNNSGKNKHKNSNTGENWFSPEGSSKDGGKEGFFSSGWPDQTNQSDGGASTSSNSSEPGSQADKELSSKNQGQNLASDTGDSSGLPNPDGSNGINVSGSISNGDEPVPGSLDGTSSSKDNYNTTESNDNSSPSNSTAGDESVPQDGTNPVRKIAHSNGFKGGRTVGFKRVGQPNSGNSSSGSTTNSESDGNVSGSNDGQTGSGGENNGSQDASGSSSGGSMVGFEGGTGTNEGNNGGQSGSAGGCSSGWSWIDSDGLPIPGNNRSSGSTWGCKDGQNGSSSQSSWGTNGSQSGSGTDSSSASIAGNNDEQSGSGNGGQQSESVRVGSFKKGGRNADLQIDNGETSSATEVSDDSIKSEFSGNGSSAASNTDESGLISGNSLGVSNNFSESNSDDGTPSSSTNTKSYADGSNGSAEGNGVSIKGSAGIMSIKTESGQSQSQSSVASNGDEMKYGSSGNVESHKLSKSQAVEQRNEQFQRKEVRIPVDPLKISAIGFMSMHKLSPFAPLKPLPLMPGSQGRRKRSVAENLENLSIEEKNRDRSMEPIERLHNEEHPLNFNFKTLYQKARSGGRSIGGDHGQFHIVAGEDVDDAHESNEPDSSEPIIKPSKSAKIAHYKSDGLQKDIVKKSNTQREKRNINPLRMRVNDITVSHDFYVLPPILQKLSLKESETVLLNVLNSSTSVPKSKHYKKKIVQLEFLRRKNDPNIYDHRENNLKSWKRTQNAMTNQRNNLYDQIKS